MASKPPNISTGRFSINAFRSEIHSKGVMRPQYFHVEIHRPKTLEKAYSDITNIALRCESTVLPGIDLQDGYNGPRAGYGVKEYIPYNVDHKPINFTFIMDEGTYVQDFFLRWMNSIVNFNNQTSSSTVNKDVIHYSYRGSKLYDAYEVGYKDDYSTIVSIYGYNPLGEQTFNVNLYQAFPISISDVQLTWNDTDQIGRLTVPISFKNFEYQTKLTTV